jgi:hypothetical protein
LIVRCNLNALHQRRHTEPPSSLDPTSDQFGKHYDTPPTTNKLHRQTTSVLSAYQTATGKRRNWRLPQRSVPNAEPQRSTLGYSTHTANTVFWIADRSGLLDERSFFQVETYAVYSAKF